MIRTNRFLLASLLSGMFLFTACSSDDNPSDDSQTPGSSEQYVVMSTDTENTYLLTAEDISQGSIAPNASNSRQVIGTPTWYFAKDIATYGFIYRQGDPGTTQSFSLNADGKLEARNEINLNVSIQSRGMVDDEIFLQYSSRNYLEPTSTFYKINPITQAVSGPFVINTENMVDNGEYAYLTDIAGYQGKVLIGIRTIKAGSDGGEETDDLFASDFNDHTYVGVFNKDLELEKIIEDQGRTGVVAGQLRAAGETGIEPVENGDIYMFSSALDAPDVPSGVLKINGSSLEFDQNYFFNISEASGGYKLFRTYYAGNNNFVLRMFTEPNTASGSPDDTRNKFAVVNVANQTFNWVDNVPSGILSIGEPHVDKSVQKVVFPIETSGYPTLYHIDVPTATMTAGMEIKAEEVTAVGKLTIQ